ncbi:IS1380 family transposase, partial [Tannerella forsythia]
QMLDKIGFQEQVSSCLSLPTQNSNRAYDVGVILESFITSIWCGANRFLHTEVTRVDKALGHIFGWKHPPAQDAYKRYFSKFNAKT